MANVRLSNRIDMIEADIKTLSQNVIDSQKKSSALSFISRIKKDIRTNKITNETRQLLDQLDEIIRETKKINAISVMPDETSRQDLETPTNSIPMSETEFVARVVDGLKVMSMLDKQQNSTTEPLSQIEPAISPPKKSNRNGFFNFFSCCLGEEVQPSNDVEDKNQLRN